MNRVGPVKVFVALLGLVLTILLCGIALYDTDSYPSKLLLALISVYLYLAGASRSSLGATPTQTQLLRRIHFVEHLFMWLAIGAAGWFLASGLFDFHSGRSDGFLDRYRLRVLGSFQLSWLYSNALRRNWFSSPPPPTTSRVHLPLHRE